MAGEQLRVTEGNARGGSLEVEADLLIGRAAPDDEGRLGDDPEISRRHALVSRGAGGALTIEDLGSANGTFVNGERIDAPRGLDLGDSVTMGQTVLQVTDASGRVPEPTQLGADIPAAVAAAPVAAAQEFVVTAGPAAGRRLALDDEFVIGRAVSGEGRLADDPELSRRHARVMRSAGGALTIEDLGSANGTFVNGVRLSEPRALELGDSIRVGETTMELTEAGQPASPPRAPAPPARPAASPPPPPRAAAPPRPPARPPTPPPVRPPTPPPVRPPAPPPARPPAPQPVAREPEREVGIQLPPGTVFAGCRVEEMIGHGDMGIVYRAEELALQRPVALKLILPEHSEEERFRERFRRESKLAASIDHPNVIPVLEAGDEEGVLFIRMRLVEGTDLRTLIAAEGPVAPRRAARIIRQVGAALDAAHARGLVHRDVKPANVLLARADHVYLSDFGLAKSASDLGGLTRQGSIVARAEYVAPEQIIDDRVDALTDVYALGCLLFEALTGEAPYATLTGGGAMMAHVDAPPPSPLERRPDLPPELDAVVRRAMAKDPAERYPSAGDLGEAALAAAGGRRRATAESVIATGDALPQALREAQLGRPPAGEPEADEEAAEAGPGGALRWVLPLGVLAVLAAGMVAALEAFSKL